MSWKYVQRDTETGQYRTTDQGGGGGSSHTYSTTEQVIILILQYTKTTD